MTENYQSDFDGTEIVHELHLNPAGTSFIYALMDENENIVYIGQSKTPIFRIYSHAKDKKFSKYKLFECDSEKVNQIEFSMYSKYKPKLNVVPPSDETYCSIDNYRIKNKELRGKIKFIRSFTRDNPVETRAGRYPVAYLEKMKQELING